MYKLEKEYCRGIHCFNSVINDLSFICTGKLWRCDDYYQNAVKYTYNEKNISYEIGDKLFVIPKDDVIAVSESFSNYKYVEDIPRNILLSQVILDRFYKQLIVEDCYDLRSNNRLEEYFKFANNDILMVTNAKQFEILCNRIYERTRIDILELFSAVQQGMMSLFTLHSEILNDIYRKFYRILPPIFYGREINLQLYKTESTLKSRKKELHQILTTMSKLKVDGICFSMAHESLSIYRCLRYIKYLDYNDNSYSNISTIENIIMNISIVDDLLYVSFIYEGSMLSEHIYISLDYNDTAKFILNYLLAYYDDLVTDDNQDNSDDNDNSEVYGLEDDYEDDYGSVERDLEPDLIFIVSLIKAGMSITELYKIVMLPNDISLLYFPRFYHKVLDNLYKENIISDRTDEEYVFAKLDDIDKISLYNRAKAKIIDSIEHRYIDEEEINKFKVQQVLKPKSKDVSIFSSDLDTTKFKVSESIKTYKKYYKNPISVEDIETGKIMYHISPKKSLRVIKPNIPAEDIVNGKFIEIGSEFEGQIIPSISFALCNIEVLLNYFPLWKGYIYKVMKLDQPIRYFYKECEELANDNAEFWTDCIPIKEVRLYKSVEVICIGSFEVDYEKKFSQHKDYLYIQLY